MLLNDERILDVLKHIKLPKTAKVLDVGCGEGRFVTAINRYLKIYCVGFDINPGIKSNVIKADAINIPFQDSIFDYVICRDVIEHVINPRILLEEITRVMKKESLLYISTPNKYLHRLYTQFLAPKHYKERAEKEHLWEFTYREFKKMLKMYFARINLYPLTIFLEHYYKPIKDLLPPMLAWRVKAICKK